MKTRLRYLLMLLAFALLAGASESSQRAHAYEPLVYEGDSGPGVGKHLVFIANDHEYRSEQTCPLMAKILAKHHGFRCTVLFGIDDQGEIKSGSAGIPGLEALQDADMLFFFARFMKLADGQADQLVDYFERGGPVVGLRTSTHAFNGQRGKWEKLNFNYQGEDYYGGLGEQIFGNTWHKERGQSHYGQNHVMGCRIAPIESEQSHPVLRGVRPFHAYSGAYKSQPPGDAVDLLEVQVLNTLGPSDDVNSEKPVVNAGWARQQYIAPSGASKAARVVYASFGASEDMLSEDARRFLVNACFWGCGMEDAIRDDLDVSIVGGYHPSPYMGGDLFYEGVKPADLAGFDSHIMPVNAPLAGVAQREKARRIARAIQHRPRLREKLRKKYPELYGSSADQP